MQLCDLGLKVMRLILIVDVNECMEDTDNCSQNCNNTIGSYECYCNDGYTLDYDDLHTCNGTYRKSSTKNCFLSLFSCSYTNTGMSCDSFFLFLQTLMNVWRVLQSATIMLLV